MAKKWSDEDKDRLEKLWGAYSMSLLCKEFNRTPSAIQNKAIRMKLGDMRFAADSLTVRQVAIMIGRAYRTLTIWRKNYGFPAYRKILNRKSYWVVKPAAFWAWVKENPERITAGEIERGVISPEPEWVEEARRTTPIPKRYTYRLWTTKEEEQLKVWIAEGVPYKEAGARLGRTVGSITNKVNDFKERRAEEPKERSRRAAGRNLSRSTQRGASQ